MLRLIIKGDEVFDEETNTFSTVGDRVLDLEHSLVSLSKWESKHLVPFLGTSDKSTKEILSYVMAMVLDQNVGVEILEALSQENLDEIIAYIDSPATATTFGMMPERKGREEVITSELIYYWLVAFNIPFEVETWHLNRLFALVRVCNVKNSKPKKISRTEMAQRNREINAKRREQYNTSG